MFERIADHPVVRKLREEGYPEAPVCFYCRECGGEIYLDDWYFEFDGEVLCEACADDHRHVAG